MINKIRVEVVMFLANLQESLSALSLETQVLVVLCFFVLCILLTYKFYKYTRVYIDRLIADFHPVSLTYSILVSFLDFVYFSLLLLFVLLPIFWLMKILKLSFSQILDTILMVEFFKKTLDSLFLRVMYYLGFVLFIVGGSSCFFYYTYLKVCALGCRYCGYSLKVLFLAWYAYVGIPVILSAVLMVRLYISLFKWGNLLIPAIIITVGYCFFFLFPAIVFGSKIPSFYPSDSQFNDILWRFKSKMFFFMKIMTVWVSFKGTCSSCFFVSKDFPLWEIILVKVIVTLALMLLYFVFHKKYSSKKEPLSDCFD